MASILKLDTLQTPSGSGVITSPNTIVSPGNVIQVVTNSIKPGSTSTTSSTLSNTGLSATITPKLSTSKILVLICHYECYVSAANKALRLAVLRNDTIVGDYNNATMGYVGATANYFNVNIQFFETPNTTNALTYKTQFASTYGTGETVAVHGDNTTSYITLMEIAQ